jgi:hypothetical protein
MMTMPPLYYPVIRCILSTDKGNLNGFAVLVLAVLLFHLIVSLQQYGHAKYNRLVQHLLGDKHGRQIRPDRHCL